VGRLKNIPLLASLDGKAAAALDSRAAFKRYEESELVVDFDDESNDVYFVLQGRVRVLYRTPTGKEVILAELGPGECFGELAAVDGVTRSANVTAIQSSELAIMPGSVFVETATHNPGVALAVMKLLAARVRALNIKVSEHSFLSLKHRLYAELLRLSRPRGGGSGERAISPPPYQHDLAARIGCRREQVSRELSTLQREGLIERTRGAIVLKDPAELNRRISAAFQE